MSDKVLIYPFVNKSDAVHTKYNINPNSVTLFNNLVVTPILFYYLYYDYYLLTIAFVWIRSYFDGLDGYIARKFDKCSKEGEIYDHFSDCLYSGTMTTTLMSKMVFLQPYSISTGYAMSVVCIVCDYDKRFYFIAEFAGAGGNEDGYSFLLPFVAVAFTWLLNIFGFI